MRKEKILKKKKCIRQQGLEAEYSATNWPGAW